MLRLKDEEMGTNDASGTAVLYKARESRLLIDVCYLHATYTP